MKNGLYFEIFLPRVYRSPLHSLSPLLIPLLPVIRIEQTTNATDVISSEILIALVMKSKKLVKQRLQTDREVKRSENENNRRRTRLYRLGNEVHRHTKQRKKKKKKGKTHPHYHNLPPFPYLFN